MATIALPDRSSLPSDEKLRSVAHDALVLAEYFADVAWSLVDDPKPSSGVLAAVRHGMEILDKKPIMTALPWFDFARAVEYASRTVREGGSADEAVQDAAGWFESRWPTYRVDPTTFRSAVDAWSTGRKWKDVAAAVEKSKLTPASPNTLTQTWSRYVDRFGLL